MIRATQLRHSPVEGVTGREARLLAQLFTYQLFTQRRCWGQRGFILYSNRTPFAYYDQQQCKWIVIDDAWIRDGIPIGVFMRAMERLRRRHPDLSYEDGREIIMDALSQTVDLQHA